MQLGYFQAKQGFFRIHLQHTKENPRMVKFRSFSLRYSLNIILNEKFNPYENSQDIFSPRISASFLNFQKGGKRDLFRYLMITLKHLTVGFFFQVLMITLKNVTLGFFLQVLQKGTAISVPQSPHLFFSFALVIVSSEALFT